MTSPKDIVAAARAAAEPAAEPVMSLGELTGASPAPATKPARSSAAGPRRPGRPQKKHGKEIRLSFGLEENFHIKLKLLLVKEKLTMQEVLESMLSAFVAGQTIDPKQLISELKKR